ncbi:hypothetical protein DL95DRAFT_381233 [Leptodontidium sp. 2 PMI_412]|nr:hypothetical protein DL95DRAFT_381233 [Leptodontidium sp. 2 PMI_412]
MMENTATVHFSFAWSIMCVCVYFLTLSMFFYPFQRCIWVDGLRYEYLVHLRITHDLEEIDPIAEGNENEKSC